MLSQKDNVDLCRVGPGTLMGQLMREYWIPAFLSTELPGECWPRRVRLLGENLVAFRDDEGRVGVVDENCPHRGASMLFGRNEETGIRCAYHGWKFDVMGACVDMPSETAENGFKYKVTIKAYTTRERNGIVWLYMGPRQESPPPLPDLEVNLDGGPRDPGEPYKYVRQCNWAQALEGDLDRVHVPFLHTRVKPGEFTRDGKYSEIARLERVVAERNPYLEPIETSYGFFAGARHEVDAAHDHWGIYQFIMPFYTMVRGYGGKVWMPIDDNNTLVMEWKPARPLGMSRDQDDETQNRQPWGYKPDDLTIPWGNWRLKADVENEWLRVRSRERDVSAGVHYVGILSNPLQDSAVQISMGPVYDRTREHLGTTDKQIISFRRMMLRSAKALAEREEIPPTVGDSTLYRVRGTAFVLPKGMDWKEISAPWREAFSSGVPEEYRARNALAVVAAV